MDGFSVNAGTVTHTDVDLQEQASGLGAAGRTRLWLRRAVEKHPLMLALGSMTLGVFASWLILLPRGRVSR